MGMRQSWLLFLLLSLNTFSQISETEIEVSPLLKGTLFETGKPSGGLIVLIAGSGATNRSGNQIGQHNNSLRYLALELSKKGFSVFSYDKRHFTQMVLGNLDENLSRFDDLVHDARSVLKHFRENYDYEPIVVAGHSEGSLVGMLAADGIADGFISIAGPGRPMDQVLQDQLSKIFPGKTDLIAKNLNTLKKGETFKNDDSGLAMVFRESVQPYLISWIRHDPAKILSRLEVPILIVNGTKDLQMPESEARLLKKSHPRASIAIIENMNHVLKIIRGGEDQNKASYNDPALPVSAELVDVISEFVNKLNP